MPLNHMQSRIHAVWIPAFPAGMTSTRMLAIVRSRLLLEAA